MFKTLYYSINIDEYDISISQYPYKVYENFDDIFAYYFEKKYGHKYDWHNWFLEKDAEKFYREINNKWLHNQIDTIELYSFDVDFSDWLQEKYENEAYEKVLREAEEHTFDDYKYF